MWPLGEGSDLPAVCSSPDEEGPGKGGRCSRRADAGRGGVGWCRLCLLPRVQSRGGSARPPCSAPWRVRKRTCTPNQGPLPPEDLPPPCGQSRRVTESPRKRPRMCVRSLESFPEGQKRGSCRVLCWLSAPEPQRLRMFKVPDLTGVGPGRVPGGRPAAAPPPPAAPGLRSASDGVNRSTQLSSAGNGKFRKSKVN